MRVNPFPRTFLSPTPQGRPGSPRQLPGRIAPPPPLQLMPDNAPNPPLIAPAWCGGGVPVSTPGIQTPGVKVWCPWPICLPILVYAVQDGSSVSYTGMTAIAPAGVGNLGISGTWASPTTPGQVVTFMVRWVAAFTNPGNAAVALGGTFTQTSGTISHPGTAGVYPLEIVCTHEETGRLLVAQANITCG